MIDGMEKHPYFKSFEEIVNVVGLLFKDYVSITINSLEACVKVNQAKDIKMSKINVGDLISHDTVTYRCMQEQRAIISYTPVELFGIPLKTIALPMFDENNGIIGCCTISLNLNRQKKIQNLANELINPINHIAQKIAYLSSSLQDIAKENQNALKNIDLVTAKSENTNEIISYIEDVSNKTNLLGLNASIESARAGSLGACFGVISQEIMKISKENKASTEKIASTLIDIKKAINEVNGTINNIDGNFQNQLSSVQEITASIEEITGIANMLEEKIQNFQ